MRLLILLVIGGIVSCLGVQPNRRGLFNDGDDPDSRPYGKPGDFDMYIFAQVWAPQFCCEHPDIRECRPAKGANSEGMWNASEGNKDERVAPLPDFWGATHLTLHGLWPQYNHSRQGHMWPQYCTKVPLHTDVLLKFKSKWETYAPAYRYKEYYLAKHEWMRHGTCSGLEQLDYFMTSLDLITQYSTPDILMNNIGKLITRAEIEAAYGGRNQVALACSEDGSLEQVVTCWSSRHGGRLAGRAKACPSDVLNSRGTDNTCGDHIFIRRVGDC